MDGCQPKTTHEQRNGTPDPARSSVSQSVGGLVPCDSSQSRAIPRQTPPFIEFSKREWSLSCPVHPTPSTIMHLDRIALHRSTTRSKIFLFLWLALSGISSSALAELTHSTAAGCTNSRQQQRYCICADLFMIIFLSRDAVVQRRFWSGVKWTLHRDACRKTYRNGGWRCPLGPATTEQSRPSLAMASKI